MTRYNIKWSEKKNPDWIVAELIDTDGLPYDGVSINRTNKKGETFPAFDSIMTGHDIEGEAWKSPAGKWYLFPPKPATANFGRSGGIAKAQEKKAEFIKEAQERKAESIAYFNSVNSAIALLHEKQLDDDRMKAQIQTWRDWFISEYEKWNKQ